MGGMHPIVYLPVEIKYRELPSRLLIARYMLQAGYAVVIGNHWSMTSPPNQAAFPEGLYLFKSVNRLQGNIMQLLRTNGHVVAANDEEALNFIEYNGYTVAFGDNAADACALFFAQSPAHKAAIERRFPQLAGKVTVSGNPRIDLLSAKNRSAFLATDERVAACKPYILFNTNYSLINSVWGERVFAIAEGTGAFDGPDRDAKVREFQDIFEWEKRNHQAMLELLEWTARNVSGVNLVVRPHPGEKPSTWEQILAAIPNGRLIARSDPHPWILGAKLLVHSGCTTGLEAVLLGTPAIDIMPTDHPTCDRIVSYANPRYRKPEDAAQAITAFLQRREGFPAGQATAALETHLPSYRDDTAAKIMAQGLAAELAKHDAPPRKGFELTWRAPFTEYQRSAAERDKYAATVDEIREGLRKAAVVAGASGEVRVETIGEGLFLATPR